MRLLNSMALRACIALFALLASGCGSDDECGVDMAKVTYRSHAQFVVARHCVDCHDVAKTGAQRRNAPESHNYNSFAEVAKYADRMADRLRLDQMPPAGGVSSCDKRIFDAWISAGKPER